MSTAVRGSVATAPRPALEPATDHPPAPNETATARVAWSRADIDWERWVSLGLVAFAVAFSAWCLRSELRSVLYSSDAAGHDSMVRFAAQRIRAGNNPFDAWYPYLGLGAPHFVQYQSLAHIVTGAVSIVFGGSAFRQETYLLLCTWPVSVYVGARLLGLDRVQAGAAALFSPMMSNITGYGFEWKSFIWSGTGLWSMLWAIWLLPIALGLAWRAVAKRERLALAAFVVGLTCALHFMTGYLVLLAFVVFVVLHPPDFAYRLARSATVGLGGLAIFAFVFVPALRALPYVNVNAFEVGTHWFDSYGPGHVFGWLVSGEVFDHERLPIVTAFVFVGVIVCAARAKRSEAARLPLALLALSLALYSGRSVVGPVVNYLPGGGALFLHRYIMGVHLAGMFLAGIALAWLLRSAAHIVPRFLRAAPARIVACVAIAICTGAALYPVVANRAEMAAWNTAFISYQQSVDTGAGRDVTALLDIAKARGGGRVYAGASNDWGAYTKVGVVPLYMFAVQRDVDSLGLIARTDSLSADVEPYFNDTIPAQYDLFDVKYILVPAHQKPDVQATLLARRGDYALYEVATSGYLEVVDTTAAVQADRSNIYAIARPYLKSRALAEGRHPFVAFAGRATPAPSIADAAPFTGAPGTVDDSQADLDNGRFSAKVDLRRPGWVMLKESYAPGWTATVDGRPAQTAMLAPSFVGVAVPAGTHHVRFVYRSRSSYPPLFAIGALVLAGLAATPMVMRYARRRRHARTTPA